MTIATRPTGWTDYVEGVWGVKWTDRGAATRNTDGRIFYVQPNHVEAVDNGNTGESPLTPLATITAALALCSDDRGDVILVGGNDAWTYGGGGSYANAVTENVVVDVEGVSIIGVAPGALGVPWQPATDGGTCITINALNVEIAGFVFQDPDWGAGRAIYAIWTGTTQFGENAHIHHCFFYSDLAVGIDMEYSWNNYIHDCQFQEVPYGIYCDPAGDGFAYSVIERCYFRNCSTSAISATDNGCDDNRVSDCWVWNSAAQAGGAATDEGFDFQNGSMNMVTNCWFSCILPAAAPGDFDDLNTATATDAWINCHCINGDSTTNPT